MLVFTIHTHRSALRKPLLLKTAAGDPPLLRQVRVCSVGNPDRVLYYYDGIHAVVYITTILDHDSLLWNASLSWQVAVSLSVVAV
jgi:hypothetical protein